MCLNIFTLDTFLILVERVNLKSGPCLDSIIPFRSDFIWEDFSEWGGGRMRALILQEFKISMIEGQGRYRSWQMVRILHFYCI